MIANKDFKSNCKRIAQWIMSHNEAIDVDMLAVPLSRALKLDVVSNSKQRRAYIKAINRELLNMSWKDEDDECIEYYFTVDRIEVYEGTAVFFLSENRIYKLR